MNFSFKNAEKGYVRVRVFVLIFCLSWNWNSYSLGTTKMCAKTLEDIRLDDQFCMKLRNQDSVGWCYAFAAADLLGAHMNRKHGADPCVSQISPLGMVSQFVKHHRADKRKEVFDKITRGEFDLDKDVIEAEGGRVLDSLILASMKEYCFESELKSEDNKWSEKLECSYCDLELAFNQMFDYYGDPGRPVCKERSIAAIQSIFKFMNAKDISKALEEMKMDELFDYLVEKQCQHKLSHQGKSKMPNFKSYYYDAFLDSDSHFKAIMKAPDYDNDGDTYKRPLDWEKVIDENLEKGLPLGADIYSGFLKGKEITKAQIIQNDLNEIKNKEDVNFRHSVIIMGKQHNCETGKDEYVIRNSWGSDCGPYHKKKTNEEIGDEQLCQSNIYPESYREKNRQSQKSLISYYMVRGDMEAVESVKNGFAKDRYVPDDKLDEIKANCLKPPEMANPKVRCTAGVVYVEKEEFIKHMYRATVVE